MLYIEWFMESRKSVPQSRNFSTIESKKNMNMNVKHEELTVRALYDLSYTAALSLLKPAPTRGRRCRRSASSFKALGKNTFARKNTSSAVKTWSQKRKLCPNIICRPHIIRPETEVRPGAFIRDNALISAGCVVAIPPVKKTPSVRRRASPHYNYIGDSVMGHKARTGAGAVVRLKAGSLATSPS